jgi:hypothetical protein
MEATEPAGRPAGQALTVGAVAHGGLAHAVGSAIVGGLEARRRVGATTACRLLCLDGCFERLPGRRLFLLGGCCCCSCCRAKGGAQDERQQEVPPHSSSPAALWGPLCAKGEVCLCSGQGGSESARSLLGPRCAQLRPTRRSACFACIVPVSAAAAQARPARHSQSVCRNLCRRARTHRHGRDQGRFNASLVIFGGSAAHACRRRAARQMRECVGQRRAGARRHTDDEGRIASTMRTTGGTQHAARPGKWHSQCVASSPSRKGVGALPRDQI